MTVLKQVRLFTISIELPVIVIEDGDVTVCLTQKDAECHLETTDAMGGNYEAFDAKRHLLQLKPRGKRVLMSLAETEPTHAEALSRTLVGHLTFLKDPIDKSAELDLLEPFNRLHPPGVSSSRNWCGFTMLVLMPFFPSWLVGISRRSLSPVMRNSASISLYNER